MSYAALISQEKQDRLLMRLRTIPIPLLCDCTMPRDFICSTRLAGDASTAGRTVRYIPALDNMPVVLPGRLGEFRPVVVGNVKKLLPIVRTPFLCGLVNLTIHNRPPAVQLSYTLGSLRTPLPIWT